MSITSESLEVKQAAIDSTKDSSVKEVSFDEYFIGVLCKPILKVIYKNCWPNELAGPSILRSKQPRERWTTFSRESYANMLKFARFFGLSAALRVSLREKLQN